MIDGDLFRETMRQWAAGVTVLTVEESGKVHGMTANSFTSVSAAPPLMLFCVGQTNDTHDKVKVGSIVGVNLLSDTQAEISGRFASKTGKRYQFDDLKQLKGPRGSTLFQGCAAVMEAVVSQVHEAGDHTIFICEINWAEHDHTKMPLVYSKGGYNKLMPFQPETEKRNGSTDEVEGAKA